MVDVLDDHCTTVRSDAACETLSEGNADALLDLLFDALRGAGDQVARVLIKEEEGARIRLQRVGDAVEERREQLVQVQVRERSIGDGLDPKQAFLRFQAFPSVDGTRRVPTLGGRGQMAGQKSSVPATPGNLPSSSARSSISSSPKWASKSVRMEPTCPQDAASSFAAPTSVSSAYVTRRSVGHVVLPTSSACSRPSSSRVTPEGVRPRRRERSMRFRRLPST